MVKISWTNSSATSTTKEQKQLIKTIQKNWENKFIKDIWEEAKKLLDIPKNCIITRYEVNGKVVNDSYILQPNDELFLITTEVSDEILEKKLL